MFLSRQAYSPTYVVCLLFPCASTPPPPRRRHPRSLEIRSLRVSTVSAFILAAFLDFPMRYHAPISQPRAHKKLVIESDCGAVLDGYL